MPDFKQNLLDLIAKSQLEKALELAKKQAMDGATDLDTPIALLLADLEFSKKQARQNAIDANGERTIRQNISYRLMNIVEDWIKNGSNTEGATSVSKDVILFLGANPFAKLVLELGREVEEVSRGLTQFGRRSAFDFRAQMHVSPSDLQRLLLSSDTSARFVHFAGNAVVDHATYGSGVVFETDNGQPQVVGGKVLAAIFSQFPNVECVVLNTCDSGLYAFDIGQKVKYAIGMNSRIWDDTAIRFAVAFYEAIGNGRDVPFAFQFAKTRLMLDFPYAPEQADIPILVADGKCAEPLHVVGDSHLDAIDCVRQTR